MGVLEGRASTGKQCAGAAQSDRYCGTGANRCGGLSADRALQALLDTAARVRTRSRVSGCVRDVALF